LDHIVLNNTDCGAAIARLAGTDFNPQTAISICRLRDGARLGGVLFTHYTGESIAMHSASWHPRWINRDMLYVAFDYPFNQLGVKRIFGQVSEDNLHARAFNENIGFRTVARIEGVFRGNVACIVMRLDREDCRFLKIKPRNILSNKVLN
jgi:RimJ/RimL family protein N-acetyltransferase